MKLQLNSALRGLRGIMDDWVYKRFEKDMVVAHRPTPTTAAPTAPQLRVRDRFADAAAYARAVFADPARRAVYAEAHKRNGRTGSTLWSVVAGDFLHLPEVKELNLDEYGGRIGDPIKIWAEDDFEVVAVTVAIKDAATGNVIEHGAAVMGDTRWIYSGTTAIAAGRTVEIEATVVDRTGNNTAASETWTAP